MKMKMNMKMAMALAGVFGAVFCGTAIAASPAPKDEKAVATPAAKGKASAKPGKPAKDVEPKAAPAAPAAQNLDDPYEARRNILAKYRGASKYSLGLFPGTVSGTDGFTLLTRYLPLTNHLSEKTQSIVSFVPLVSRKDILKAVDAKNHDFLYINAETAVAALKAGYVPLVRRNDPIQGVWLAKADSPLAAVTDLAGKRVGLVNGAMVSTLSKYELIEKKITDKVGLVDIPSGGQNALVLALKEGLVDSILIRKTVADKLVKEGGYKIIAETKIVPGFILMSNKMKSIPDSLSAAMAAGMLDLSATEASHSTILSGFDVGQEKGVPFVSATSADLELMGKVLDSVGPAKFKMEALGSK